MAATEKKKRTGPITYARQVRAEGSKVTWTTRQETLYSTVMVLILSAIIAFFLFLSDQVAGSFISWVTGLGG